MLATCFYFAFSNLVIEEEFATIKIAYDNEDTENDALKEAINQAEMTEGTSMFAVTYCDKEEANKLLNSGEIDAYIVGSNNPELFVMRSGLNETIIKAFLDSYRQMSATVETILKNNPEAMNNGLLEDVMQYESFVYEEKGKKNPDIVLVYFYSLLAFTCIFASNWGFDEVICIQADQSFRGARINVSPIHKMKLFLCNMTAAFTVHSGSIILLFGYLFFALKVDFGDNLGYIFITCLIGSLTGLTLGAAVCVWLKFKREVKEAILLIVLMGGAFLSGMMMVQMKYIVADKIPLLRYINPVNLITDAFYSLYYYETYDRYLLNISILGGLAILFGILSYIGIRRRDYASI